MQNQRPDWKSRAREAVREAIQAQRLKTIPDPVISACYLPIAETLKARASDADAPFVVAMSGAPGTGKSTLAAYLEVILRASFGLRCASFSMDDLYYTHKERQELGRRIHPLLAIRGVPGTHHLQLGFSTLESLRQATKSDITRLPRFSKMTDSPWPSEHWPVFRGRPDIILIDSWFWNIGEQPDAILQGPINKRERREDPDGIWRRYVNRVLVRDYPPFFARANYWVHFKAPDWQATERWRVEQEMDLRAELPEGERPTDDPAERLRYFLQVFQRCGEQELLGTPDVAITLDDRHRIKEVVQSPPPVSPHSSKQ